MLPENIQLALELIGVDHASMTIDEAGDALRKYTQQAEQAGNSSSDAAKKSTTSWTEFRSMYSTVLDVARVGVQVWEETVGVTVELANNVRQFRDVTGQSAEESSRLVQVLDDYKITVGQAEQATKKFAKDGMEFNISTLAKLSDEYLKLNSNAERTQFLYDKFGKSGTDFAEIMLQGSDAIMEANASISENLILTDKALQQTREYEKNVDNLTDAILEQKVAIGNQLIPVANTLLELYQRTNDTIDSGEQTYSRAALYVSALAIQKENLAKSTIELDKGERDNILTTQELTMSVEEQQQAMEELSSRNKEFLSVLGSIQNETDSYKKKYEAINNDLKLSDDERIAKLQELADEHELANRKIILGLLERKLTQDGILDDNELNWLLEKGQAWGIYSEEVVSATQAAIDEVNRLSGAVNGLPTSKDIFINVTTNYSAEAQAALSQQLAGEKAYTPTRRKNADGGNYMIPMSWGNERFPIGSSDTASGGELISITPAGKSPNDEILTAIQANRIDERKLARYIVSAMAREG